MLQIPLLSLKKHSKFIPSVFALSLTGFLLAGCGPGGGWNAPPPFVVTTPAVQQDWTVTYQATGTLEANNKVDLTAEMPGSVSAIYLREGASVGRGQPLLRLKADKQLAQLEQSQAGIATSISSMERQKAEVKQAKARLESATVRKNFAESEFHRYEKLFKDEFISNFELDQKRNNYDTALASFQEAQQALSSAQAQLQQAASSVNQARSGYSYSMAVASDAMVRAPFAGLVGQKYVDLGDYISPGQKLITVVDPSVFKIDFTVPERYLSDLKPGLPVNVTFEGLGEKAYAGKVNFIDPVIDANAHTVKVKAVIPGSTGLRHGLFGNVALSLGKIPNAVVIPEEAIVPQGEKTFVYVVEREMIEPKPAEGDKKAKKPEGHLGDVAHLREITVRYRMAKLAQVESGLKAGERIITSGLQKVSDKLEVNLNAQPPAAAKGH